LLLRADQLGWPCQTKLCQPRLVRPVSAGSAYPDWSPPALPRSPVYEMRAAGEDYPEKNSDSSIIQRIKKKMYYQKNRRPKPRPKENENGEFRRWTARILAISERVLLEVLRRCKYFPRRRRLLSLRRPSTSFTGFPARCIGSPECFGALRMAEGPTLYFSAVRSAHRCTAAVRQPVPPTGDVRDGRALLASGKKFSVVATLGSRN
jgi:hypothetical protein